LIVGASVFKDHQWANKDSLGIRKVEAMFRQIWLALLASSHV
jgi:hypothetical protein